MITGTISAHHAYVRQVMRGPDGQQAEVEFVLDTGFVGFITLPPVACAALGWTYLRPQPANLADGSRIVLEVYEGILLWDDAERTIEVLAMEGAPLIGMLTLEGSDVRLQVAEGGLITIEPL